MTSTSPDADKPADTRDMVLVHRVFRREFAELPGLVRGVAGGDTARAAVLHAHWVAQHDFLHHHHAGEDAWLWSRLLDRSPEAADLVPGMEAAHARVDSLLTACDEAARTWAADPTVANGEVFAAAITEMYTALVDHLDEEEAKILPIIRATMLHSEWSQLGEEQMKTVPEQQIPFVLGDLLEDCTTDAERNVFLGELPPPVVELWQNVWSAAYAEHKKLIRG